MPPVRAVPLDERLRGAEGGAKEIPRQDNQTVAAVV